MSDDLLESFKARYPFVLDAFTIPLTHGATMSVGYTDVKDRAVSKREKRLRRKNNKAERTRRRLRERRKKNREAKERARERGPDLWKTKGD